MFITRTTWPLKLFIRAGTWSSAQTRVHADNRSYDLPDDLFEKGEVRPTKAVKPKKKEERKKANGTKNKRHFAETGIEVRDLRPAKNPCTH